MLEKAFTTLLATYCSDKENISKLWREVQKNHSKKNRSYHNLTHLENLYQSLLLIQNKIKDWDVLMFSLFYHDFVYNVLKQNNEEKSAQKATNVLKSLAIKNERILLCEEMILATKGHQISKNSDVNFFTDADLAILGSNWQDYETYFKNVRNEYRYYPDFIYNKGRVKILKHFLAMPKIFKTNHFFDKFETQAKYNLQREIDTLAN